MDRIQQCIAVLFDGDDHESALSMLDELPDNTRQDTLRLQLAAVRYSGGSLQRLRDGIELCEQDIRDLLMNAGFGEDATAHMKWIPRPFRKIDAEKWMNGDQIDGVDFGFNEDAWRLTTIQRRKKDARVISLEGVEPVVIYLVRYLSGKEELVAQNHLVKREITM